MLKLVVYIVTTVLYSFSIDINSQVICKFVRYLRPVLPAT
jgi:hypothetical protein